MRLQLFPDGALPKIVGPVPEKRNFALHGDEYDFERHDLNLLGYTLLSKGKTADAIAILKLNGEQYPSAF